MTPSLAEVECYCMQGKYTDRPITIRIDEKTFLVRRIALQLGTGTETITTYDPVIDGEISDKMLELEPPEQKTGPPGTT